MKMRGLAPSQILASPKLCASDFSDRSEFPRAFRNFQRLAIISNIQIWKS